MYSAGEWNWTSVYLDGPRLYFDDVILERADILFVEPEEDEEE